ncbi:hypothetical protein FCK90_06945 [Kocuria coralli]|uniref:Uncharacterized protein n=1 Tax=Kocuria coralli TaxID=1461025 RepID=A0A5J5KYN5_9MICC|nr:hypothetical protein [Kocuria coralli]KAA9394548.1 hypothetical protein FCK90_06945 [Kocuria coralli]
MNHRRKNNRVTRRLITAASASYTANAAFGAAVATGLIDNGRIRWVHHALFTTTVSMTTIALAASAVQRQRAGLALLPAVGPLAVLPYLGGDVCRHAAVAGSAAPFFATALTMVWRSR